MFSKTGIALALVIEVSGKRSNLGGKKSMDCECIHVDSDRLLVFFGGYAPDI